MDSSEHRSVKRSRFDQIEPEPRRPSRFDRRSRSPPSATAGSARERSPLSRERSASTENGSNRPDPAAAAAAVAAKISEQLNARKSSHEAESLPAKQLPAANMKATAMASAANINGEIYMSDGDYIKDMDVNDLRNRYIVTKASTQKMIKDETGADVTTRGSYFPDKSMATPSNPPLYLHITSTSKEGLEKAIAKINELIQQELPPLVDERRFRRRDRDQDHVERDDSSRIQKKWPEQQIPINLEPIPGFNLRAQVVGHGGAYVKHIQHETSCRVQIKGRGSGFIEAATGRESDQNMFLHVTGPDAAMVEKAKELCEDLLENVKEQYDNFKSRPQRPYGGPGGYGDRQGNGSGPYNHHHGYNDSRAGQSGYSVHSAPSHSHGGASHGSYMTPGQVSGNDIAPPTGPISSNPAPTGNSSNTEAVGSNNTAGIGGASDYAAQYAQYYGTSDPYAPYGGYAAYVQYYQQYYAAAQQAQQQQQQPQNSPPPGLTSFPSVSSPPSSEAPLPPPTGGTAPPPPSGPPPSGDSTGISPTPPPLPPLGASSGASTYSAVPPSAGL